MIVLKSSKHQVENNIKMKHSWGGNFARMKNKGRIKKTMWCSCRSNNVLFMLWLKIEWV
jgi:hypothetical protein